jgi:AraC-like DNA-binding protein/tetratricopeptide (TPR) repeat protein
MTDQLNSNQIFIKNLTEIIQANLEIENFGVKELAHEAGLSRYTLSRKLNSINGRKVNQFIREVRLQKALELLQNETLTVSEVAYKVGFSSPTYFNKCFHEYFGHPPGKIKKGGLETTDAGSHNSGGNNLEQAESSRKSFNIKTPGIILSTLFLATVLFLIYNKIHHSEGSDDLISSDGRISIAVMPFQNMTHDTTWNIWQEGIQECLISSLSNIKELKIRQKDNINALLQTIGIREFASISPKVSSRISQKLDASLFINGSIRRAGSTLRIDAQIIGTKSKEVIKSFMTIGPFNEANAFQIIDSLSQKLINYLLITKLIKDHPVWKHFSFPHTNSPEALRYNIYGDAAAGKLENQTAIFWYLKALTADSNYLDPMMGLSSVYGKEGKMEDDLQWVIRYHNKRNQWPIDDQLWADWAFALSFEPPEEAIKYLMQLQQIDDQVPNTYYLLGLSYNVLEQWDKAIPEFEKNLEICNKLGADFMKNNSAYTELGYAYHKTGQLKKEKKLYKLAEKHIPDDGPLTSREAILSFTENDSPGAKRFIEKFISIHHHRYSSSEAHISRRLAELYAGACKQDEAEEYFRKALSYEPKNTDIMNAFANFLIDNRRKLSEVSELMDKAMALASNKYDYYTYSDTEGRALYKLGRFNEALEILQKNWNSSPFPMYFMYSHLQELKKAIAEKK